VIRVRLPPYLRLTLAAWTARVIVIAVQLVSIRLLLTYLGTAQYAAFSVVTAAAGWCSLLDFGLGASVEHAVSEARARGERIEPVLRAACRLLAVILVVAVVIVLAAGPVAQQFLLRHLERQLPPQPALLLAAVGILSMLGALGAVGYRVFYATRRFHLAHRATVLASLTALGGLVLLTQGWGGDERLPAALLVVSAPAAVFALAALRAALSGSGPPWRDVDHGLARTLWRRAYRNAGLTFMSAAVFQIDYLVMSQTLRAEEIVEYALLARVFAVILVFHGVLLGANRPELTEALARREWSAADRVLRRSLGGSIGLVAAGTVAFALAADLVVRLLAPQLDLRIPRTAILMFGLALVIRVWSDIHAVALMSLDRFRILWVIVPVQAVLGIAGQYLLSRRYGVHGIIAGIGLSALAVCWLAPRQYARARDV